jgi:hypothetical protein
MWPEGEHGFGAVNGFDDPSLIAEEPHVVPIFDESILYVIFRTGQGYMGHAQSNKGDPAKPWKPSSFARYLKKRRGGGGS